jgi:hypothetical protein
VYTAIRLAQGGYGQALVDGLTSNPSPADATVFLAVWRLKLVDKLQTNRRLLLEKRLPSLANSVPLDFPDIKFINLYLNPVTSEREHCKGAIATIMEQGPDLVCLAQFAEEHFLWEDLTGILKQFSTCVFLGLALRELLSAACDIDLGLELKPLLMVGKVHGLRQPSKVSAGHAPEVRASLVVDADGCMFSIFLIHVAPLSTCWLLAMGQEQSHVSGLDPGVL